MSTTLGRVMLGVFEKRNITWGDVGKGLLLHLRSGRRMSARKCVRAAYDERCFGDGEVYDNRMFDAPIHATTEDGRRITVAFGKPGTGRAGHMLVADGHVSGSSFYGNTRPKGHDHLGPDGVLHADRGRSS